MRRFLARWAIWHFTVWAIIALLLAPVLPGGALTAALIPIVTAAPILELIRRFRARGGGGRPPYPGRAVRLFLLRPFWYGQVAGPFLAAVGILGALAGLAFGEPGDFGRGAMAIGGAALLVIGVAGWLGSSSLRVTRHRATWPDLDTRLDGLVIAQLSDLHVGPHLSTRYLERVRRAVDAAQPDMIAVTGDLVDDFGADVDVYARTFGTMAAPLGVWISAGNHDVYAGWADVRARLERLPVNVLVNESRTVRHRGAELVVVGLGDPAGRSWSRDGGANVAPDAERALAGVPAHAFTVALAHNPSLWPELARRRVRLTLSGHTHWGQLARGSWSLASQFLEHSMGRYADALSLLYIHPGTGYWGIPFRLGAWPEVALIELRRAPGEPGWESGLPAVATGR